MRILTQSGFPYSFDSSKCDECGGKCCTGESGYIWIDDNEIEALATALNLSKYEFKRDFLIITKSGFSIKEKPYHDGFACVFFDDVNKNCSVYNYRPSQCRTFPFWDYFKRNLKELKKECIGVKD